MNYPGIDGFLGTRGSLMLDVVVVAMAAILPILGWSIWQARVRHRYLLHKRVQLTLAAALVLTVTLFELDMRINGWRPRAEPSPYYGTPEHPGAAIYAIYIHLVFAVSTVLVWAFVIWRSLRKFAIPPQPGPHSRQHVFWARIAAIDMTLTAVTGWIFYYLAFTA